MALLETMGLSCKDRTSGYVTGKFGLSSCLDVPGMWPGLPGSGGVTGTAVSLSASGAASTSLCLHPTDAAATRVPPTPAWSVAMPRCTGAENPGHKLGQDQLPACRTGGHTDPDQGSRTMALGGQLAALYIPLDSSPCPGPHRAPTA